MLVRTMGDNEWSLLVQWFLCVRQYAASCDKFTVLKAVPSYRRTWFGAIVAGTASPGGAHDDRTCRVVPS